MTYNLFQEIPASIQQKILGKRSLPENVGKETAWIPLEEGRMMIYSWNYQELNDSQPRKIFLTLPQKESAEILSHENNVWKIHLQPRSLVVVDALVQQ